MPPNQMAPEQMHSNQMVPNQMAPEQILPNQMHPNQMAPEQIDSRDSVHQNNFNSEPEETRPSQELLFERKMDLLTKLYEMKGMGHKLSRQFSIHDRIEDLLEEYTMQLHCQRMNKQNQSAQTDPNAQTLSQQSENSAQMQNSMSNSAQMQNSLSDSTHTQNSTDHSNPHQLNTQLEVEQIKKHAQLKRIQELQRLNYLQQMQNLCHLKHIKDVKAQKEREEQRGNQRKEK